MAAKKQSSNIIIAIVIVIVVIIVIINIIIVFVFSFIIMVIAFCDQDWLKCRLLVVAGFPEIRSRGDGRY